MNQNRMTSSWFFGGRGGFRIPFQNTGGATANLRHSFQHLKRIAKEIVWKRLEEDYNELDSLLSDDFPRHGVSE